MPRHLPALILAACWGCAPAGDSGTAWGGDDSDGGSDSGEKIPPWPTMGDELATDGDPGCDEFARPCNHQLMLAIREDGGQWTILDEPLVRSASVADLALQQVEWEGRQFAVLWLSYIDENPGNLSANATDHVVSVATLAFDLDQVDDLAGAEAILRGQGEHDWVLSRSNIAELSADAVDPHRELVRTTDGWRHLLITVDLVLPEEGGEPAEEELEIPCLFTSRDGLEFSFEQEIAVEVPGGFGTDPDFYPLEWGSDYPAVLTEEWLPGGGGRWGAFGSRGPQLRAFEGDLSAVDFRWDLPNDGSVSSTSRRDGELAVVAHLSPEPRPDSPADIVVHHVQPDGSATTETLLPAADHPATALGLYAPSLLRLSQSVELMAFHTYIRPVEDFVR